MKNMYVRSLHGAIMLTIVGATVFCSRAEATESCITRFSFEERKIDDVLEYELREVLSRRQRNAHRPEIVLPEEWIAVYDANGEELSRYPIVFARGAIGEGEEGASFFPMSLSEGVVDVPFNEAMETVTLHTLSGEETFLIPASAKFCSGVPCLTEGTGAVFPTGVGAPIRQCCSGLLRVATDIQNFTCVACGDGTCTAPESHTSCPDDCVAPVVECVKGELIGGVCTDAPPQAPSGVISRRIPSGHKISWKRVPGTEDYAVYERNAEEEYELIEHVESGSYEVVSPVSSPTPLCYRVSAKNQFGESAPSEVVQLDVPIPGDANGDGIVDGADLNAFSLNWLESGKAWSDGDFNDDGTVNILDLVILSLYWRSEKESCDEVS